MAYNTIRRADTTTEPDDDLESRLQDLLADLPDEDINELADLAEAMHREAGGNR